MSLEDVREVAVDTGQGVLLIVMFTLALVVVVPLVAVGFWREVVCPKSNVQ